MTSGNKSWRTMPANMPAQLHDTIRRTVRALATFHDLTADEMAALFTVSRATAYRKLNGDADYSAIELGLLADRFGCSVDDFYRGIAVRSGLAAVAAS